MKLTIFTTNITFNTVLSLYLQYMMDGLCTIWGFVLSTCSIALQGVLVLIDFKWFTYEMLEYKKGVLFDLHLPAPVGFAIMRSHEVHGGGE